MINKDLFSKIEKVERIALASKVERMLRHPYKYFSAIFFREFIYKKSKKDKEVTCSTFFNTPMHVLLPSSTDIYLTGGKSHESEIRLAKYLIKQLKREDTFLDVGAHYGYFSMLAAKLVGTSGQVYSFEASPTTFKIFKKNKSTFKNISGYNLAASDSNKPLTFYEFPNLYSEYNTIDIAQFKNEQWFTEFQPKEIKIKAIVLDAFLKQEKANPKIIKIDVEGAEFSVLSGLKNYLKEHTPAIVMEYLSEERGNKAHVKAEAFLRSLNFTPHLIDHLGDLQPLASVNNHLKQMGVDSDNIVFVK